MDAENVFIGSCDKHKIAVVLTWPGFYGFGAVLCSLMMTGDVPEYLSKGFR